jgi:probable HAF family extracellular repeat protein
MSPPDTQASDADEERNMKPHSILETKKKPTLFLSGLVVVASALLALALPARAAQYFRFFNIVYPSAYITELTGINNAGAIVGVANSGGFLLQNGKFTSISIPGAETGASGINSSGQIVGSYGANDGTSNPQGYLYSGGTFTTINVPGALLTELMGINDSGTIVGSYVDENSNSNNQQGFIYSGGTFTSLNFPGAVSTYAWGINNAGQIVGFYFDSSEVNHAFIYSSGAFAELSIPGCKNSVAYGINNHGMIVGNCNNGDLAFLYNYSDHSSMFFSYPGYYTQPFAINDSGRVVGYYVLGFDAYNGFLAVPIQ